MIDQAGFAKKDMTAFVKGVGMMGYGQLHNIVEDVATPLTARAMFLKDSKGEIFILVHLEQAFVTIALKEALLNELNAAHPSWHLEERHLLLTAQHTHSAPGGYSHYPFYNFTIPGFQTSVFNTVLKAATEAVSEASKSLKDVQLSWGEIDISPDKEVAFNRSMKPFLNNPDSDRVHEEDRHLGVNRKMEALKITDKEGKLLAFLNWFGVHATSISSYNTRIHHDNKGVAAKLYEEYYPGCTAFFLQSSAGDVSPNFIWDKKLSRMVGKFKDQYESAAFNGEIQAREAQRIETKLPVELNIETYQGFFDMSVHASMPAHGAGFFFGTLEGPGLPHALKKVLSGIAYLSKTIHLMNHPEDETFYQAHGRKEVILDHKRGSFLGLNLAQWKKLPFVPEPTLRAFQTAAKAEAVETLPWIPAVIPFQMVRLGEVLLLTVPGEVTTIASRRLIAHVKDQLGDQSIKKIILTTYANGYMGYVTTPEEYDLQAYEGGHTVYGRNTLGAIQRAFDALIEQFKTHKPLPSATPSFRFPEEELRRRST
jgi:neutral ceramidase